jgi:hypothetical protein
VSRIDNLDTAQRAHVEHLKRERGKLRSPIERIAFDNDPANGPFALRLIAASESDRVEADAYGTLTRDVRFGGDGVLTQGTRVEVLAQSELGVLVRDGVYRVHVAADAINIDYDGPKGVA